ncbi:hypothetical protein ACFL4W_01340, partial [Planctomycetota bacterium]
MSEDKVHKCAKCGMAVTLAQLKAKQGGLANKKVYCREHFEELKEIAAGSTQSVGAGEARALRRAQEEPQFEEAPQSSRKPLMIVGLLGAIVLLLGGIAVALLMRDKQASAPAPGPTTAQTPGTPVPAEPVGPPEPAAPAPEPADAPPGPAPEDNAKLQAAYDAAVAAADKKFNGSIDGFQAGRRILFEQVIRKGDFADTPFADQAKEYLQAKEEELNTVIEKTFVAVRKEVDNLLKANEQIKALAKTDEFPSQYRTLDKWRSEHKNMIQHVNETSDVMLESWFKEAQKRVDDKKIDRAIELLGEIKASVEGKAFKRIIVKLDEKVAALQKLKESGVGVPGDGPVAVPIADNPDIKYFIDFEEGANLKSVSRGTLNMDNNMPGSKRCLQAQATPENEYHAERLGFSSYPNG